MKDLNNIDLEQFAPQLTLIMKASTGTGKSHVCSPLK